MGSVSYAFHMDLYAAVASDSPVTIKKINNTEQLAVIVVSFSQGLTMTKTDTCVILKLLKQNCEPWPHLTESETQPKYVLSDIDHSSGILSFHCVCYNYYITSYHTILMIVVNLVCFYVLFNLKVLRSSLHKFVVADEVFCSTEPSVSMLKYDTFRLPHEHDSDVSDKCSTDSCVDM